MRLPFVNSLTRLSLIVLGLGLWELGPGASSSFGQLKGGVTSNQQLDTSDTHVSVLVADIDHKVNIIGSGVQRNARIEGGIAADLDEFSKLQGLSSLAGKYAPCVDQYKSAYSHYLRAADLNQQYSRTRLSSSSQALKAISEQENQESSAGGNDFSNARKCSEPLDFTANTTHDQINSQTQPNETVPSNKELSAPKPRTQRGCHVTGVYTGPFADPWNVWKYRVTNAVAQHYSEGLGGAKKGVRGRLGGGNNRDSAVDFDILGDGSIGNFLRSRLPLTIGR